MKVSEKIKKLSKINPFSFDNKKPKKNEQIKMNTKDQSLNISKQYNNSQNKNNNTNKNNMRIIENYNSKLNKTLTEFRKVNLFKPEIISKKPIVLLPKNSNNNGNNIVQFLEKELNSINSEEYINDIVKMFEIFQEELIYQLEDKYNDFKINKIMKNNFEIIIKYLLNFFSIYNNKYRACISIVKNRLNNNTKNVIDNNNIINNYTNNNNNIIIFDENIKKYILTQEENIVNIINNLSSSIKTFNNKYKLLIINIENNFDSFNNKLLEIKNKLNIINRNNATTFNYNIKTKNLNYSEIDKDIEKIYLTNINLNKEMKLLDNNHKLFFEEAKEIFNNLRINHKIKLKKYQKLFNSLQNIRKNNSNNINYNKCKKGKSELKYLKINLTKLNNIKTRNLNNNINISFNKTSNSINKNNLNINLNTSQNSTNNNNSLNTTSNFDNKNINNLSIFKFEETNIEIYYISQLMLEFFDKLKILQKAIMNKEPNINIFKKEFEKYKKEIIKYLKGLKNKNQPLNIIKYKVIHEIEYSIIFNNKNEEKINQENNLYKHIINKVMDLIYDYSKEIENKINEEINKDNIKIFEEKINIFFNKIQNDINSLKEVNDKLKNELVQYNNIQKNISSKKSIIFESGKDLSLSFRDKNNLNEINFNNNKINSIEEEDSNKMNMTGSFKKSDILNINDEIINFQINLQNRIKYLEKEIEMEKNKNLNFFMELKSGNDIDINEKYTKLIKLYEDEQEKNRILEEKYLLEIEDINNNIIKYFQNLNINDNIINSIENKNIINNELNFDYTNFNFNLSLTKAEIKELNNKIKEKDEKINELKQKIGTQVLIQKDQLYKPLRHGLESLINEININDKVKEILHGLLTICLYNNDEIEKLFACKEKNINILGMFKF